MSDDERKAYIKSLRALMLAKGVHPDLPAADDETWIDNGLRALAVLLRDYKTVSDGYIRVEHVLIAAFWPAGQVR